MIRHDVPGAYAQYSVWVLDFRPEPDKGGNSKACCFPPVGEAESRSFSRWPQMAWRPGNSPVAPNGLATGK